MASNPVAANLLLVFLIAGGLISAYTIKQEVFPDFDFDVINIAVPYPGASPAEVEQGIVLVIEEAVRGLDNVKKVTSTASEGLATIAVELRLDTDKSKALADVKNAIDRIASLPQDAERPTVSQIVGRREVISVVLYGDIDNHTLTNLAETVRNDLLSKPNITSAELSGLRDPEISIEVPMETLRSYGLTLESIAMEVRAASIDLPGGGIKTKDGEVLLRTVERRDYGREFETIEMIKTPNGTTVLLGDIASVIDGFADTDESAQYDGKPAAMISIYRTGDQTPAEIADTVKTYVEELKQRLPKGVGAATWNDWSEVFEDRFELLMTNAGIGLILVLLILGLLLEARLAFWVTIGIPVSFLGSLLFVPRFDVSINMISMFAFILALGMVVDDAIVIGENIYEHRRRGMTFLKAAIKGTMGVATPVVFSILTTVAAFLPMLFVPGTGGKLFRVIPAVVISILTISLVESLFVLPSHLAHVGKAKETGVFGWLAKRQQRISRLFEWLIETTYAPSLKLALNYRHLTIATGIAMLIVTIGLIAGGRIDFSFMPRVESDVITAKAVLPFGVSVEETKKLEKRMIQSAKEELEKHGGKRITRGIYSQVGAPIASAGPPTIGGAAGGGHLATVVVFLEASEKRNISAVEFERKWRERLGPVVGIESLTFSSQAVQSAGAKVDVQLRHTDIDVLEGAAGELATSLESFNGVYDINDGFQAGKPRLDFKLKEQARSLGMTATDLARQVRSAFYGAEALRQQRGRSEIRVMVRLPENERRSEHDVEELLLMTRQGGEIPITDAAQVGRSRSYTEIKRIDGRRVVDVTSDVDETLTSSYKIQTTLESEILPKLLANHEGLTYSIEGERRETMDSMGSLIMGWLVALVAIYGLLAVPLRSYSQPLFVVMAAIPFGLVGAVMGLIIMGFEMSLIGMMGVVALSGVMVNSSLVLVHAANGYKSEGASLFDAIYRASLRRFRPIVLTSITTFGGLAPMIFETSVQARFLLPMAVTLGFGVLFGTFVTLVIVPALYLVVENVKASLGMKEHRSVLEESLEKEKK